MDSVPVEWYCEKFYRRDQDWFFREIMFTCNNSNQLFWKIYLKENRAKLTKDTLRMVQNQTLDVLPDDDVLNIALVGLTGAGKSYFGNALLGLNMNYSK